MMVKGFMFLYRTVEASSGGLNTDLEGRSDCYQSEAHRLLLLMKREIKLHQLKKLLSEGIDPAAMKREMQSARADSAISASKRPAYKLTEKDKAIADYIVDQMAARFGLTAGPF